MVLVTKAHRFSKLAFRGGVRIINPPLSEFGHMSKSRVMSKSKVHRVYFYSLAPMGPLGLIGAHVPITKVWGTLIESYSD